MTEPVDRARIEEELRVILREYVRHPGRPIEPGDHLSFDLEIDGDDASFDLIPEIHRHFGIDPPAFAWETAATFAAAVALIERYQRAPMTPEERARDEAEESRRRRAMKRIGAGLLAWLCGAAALEVWRRDAGVAVTMAGLAMLVVGQLPFLWRDGRRLRRERAAWKARRRAEARGESIPAG